MTHLRQNCRRHSSVSCAYASSRFPSTPLWVCLHQSIHLWLIYLKIQICVSFLSKTPQNCWHLMLRFSPAHYSHVSGHGKQSLQGSADLTKFPLRTAPTPSQLSFFNPFNICHSKFVSYHLRLSCSIKSNTPTKVKGTLHPRASSEWNQINFISPS